MTTSMRPKTLITSGLAEKINADFTAVIASVNEEYIAAVVGVGRAINFLGLNTADIIVASVSDQEQDAIRLRWKLGTLEYCAEVFSEDAVIRGLFLEDEIEAQEVSMTDEAVDNIPGAREAHRIVKEIFSKYL